MHINLSLYYIPKNEANTNHTCEKNREHASGKPDSALAGIELKRFRRNKSKLATKMQQQWQLKHGEQQAD
jgi:hypothetical protein